MDPTAANGCYGLWCGNGFQDSYITTRDYTVYFNDSLNSTAGYYDGDFNLDGLADDADYDLWRANALSGVEGAVSP